MEGGHVSVLQPYLLERRHGISEYSMASLMPFTKKRAYTVSSYTDSAGNPQYLFKGTQNTAGHTELYAFLPGGYPGRAMLDDLFTQVAEVNTIGKHQFSLWQEQLEENHSGLILMEDRDNADYLYDRQELVNLTGQSLHKKLVHALHFAEDHPNRVLIPSQQAKTADMVVILDEWSAGRALVEDYAATLLAIEHRNELGLLGAVLYADDKPVAFTLGESDGDTRFIIHFEKAIPGPRGVYQYINRAFAASLPETVVEVNREQDLGILGLRQAKLTYKPSGFVWKYKIRRIIQSPSASL